MNSKSFSSLTAVYLLLVILANPYLVTFAATINPGDEPGIASTPDLNDKSVPNPGGSNPGESKPVESKLVVELSEGVETVSKPSGNKIAAVAPLKPGVLEQLLKRLPPAEGIEKQADFNIPQGVNPPPRPGKIVKQEFPPPATSGSKEAAQDRNRKFSGPLTVLRHGPVGALKNVSDINITFSQPMVPITAAESELLAKDLPVNITPMPRGKWRWLGTQTLVFQPENKSLPKATTYKIEVPKGTSSALGSKLASALSWTITTPAAQVRSFTPSNETDDTAQSLDPIMLAAFDQKVGKNALAAIHLTEGKTPRSLRLATEQELKANKSIFEISRALARETWIAFKSTQSFAKNQTISVLIGPGIPSAEGPLLGKSVQNYQFQTYGAFHLEQYSTDTISPSDSFDIPFSNPIDDKYFKSSMLSIKPPVDNLSIVPSYSSLNISGNFRPNTKYLVTIDKSIKDTFGQTLEASKPITISVGISEPLLVRANSRFAILPASKTPTFGFLTNNVNQVKVSVYKVNPEDYKKFNDVHYDYEGWHSKLEEYGELKGFVASSSKVLAIPKAVDQFRETQIDLLPYLNDGIGNAIVTVEKWPRVKDNVQRFAVWLEATKIGIDAFSDERSAVVFATNLKDGTPLAGAEVGVLGGKKSAVTDRDGLARFVAPNESSKYLYCKFGNDRAWVPYSEAFKAGSNINALRDSLRWYSVTDRNLYRPGEQVQARGWVRRFGDGPKGDISLLADAADSISYKIYDGNGVELSTGEGKLDDLGGFAFSFDLAKTANLGYARAEITAKKNGAALNLVQSSTSLTFKIEEFRRPEFEMSVKSSAGNSLVLGQSTELIANAKYFAGGPLADAPIEWNVQTSTTSYTPAGWSDFHFGKHVEIYGFFRHRPGLYPGQASESKTFSGVTDSNGKHVLSLKIKTLAEPYPVSIVGEGTVSDVNRQSWSDKATILMHPADVYVGLRSLKQFYHANEPVRLEAIVTDLEGKAVAGRSVHVDLVRSKTVFKAGSYESIEENLVSKDFTSESNPTKWDTDLKQGGSITVRALVTDSAGRKNKSEFSFWKEEKLPEENKKVEKGKIVLLADRKEYSPGETAELLVQAPFLEGYGVLSIRRNGLYSTSPIVIKDGSGTVKIPITEDLMPNTGVQVDLVGPNCAYASGTVELSISTASRRVTLALTPAQKSLAPGANASIAIKASDSKGNALANSQIAIAVVDESVLALSAYDWADPISAFYSVTSPETNDFYGRQYVVLPPKPQDGSVRTKGSDKAKGMVRRSRAMKDGGASESYSRGGWSSGPISAPAPMLQGATNGTIGPQGDDASLAQANTPIVVRTNFNALAYFNPKLITDSSGTAKCEFKLPDNLTRYRIMAVAVSGARFCGKGDSTIIARLPLMVRPSAPRFLNFGDRCEMPVVIQNQTDEELSVDLGLRATNLKFIPSFMSTASSSSLSTSPTPSAYGGNEPVHISGGNVLVPANDRVEVRFPMSTENDGKARVEIAAVSGSLEDAANVSLPVYTPATSHAFAAYGQIDEGGAEQIVETPGDVFEQVGGLELSTSSTALQSLTDAFIYLKDYSFLCSEQLSARILASTALQDVLTAFNKMSPTEQSAVKTQIQSDIDELLKRQNIDGSYGLWKKGEAEAWPFVSIQVARALTQARSKKYRVSDESINKSKEYLRKIELHLKKNKWDGAYEKTLRRAMISYSLYVRYLMKDADPAKVRSLIKEGIAAYDLKSTSPPQKIPFVRSEGRTQILPNASVQDKLLSVFSLESLGWLLPVISADKNSQSDRDLLRSVISSRAKETASTAEFVSGDPYGDDYYCMFYSPNRLNAVMLESLMVDQPKNDLIPKLVNSLLAHRRQGRWENTQENFTVLLALDHYFAAYEKEVPNFVANTWLGQQFVGANKFVGRSTETQVINVPMRFLQTHKQDKDVLVSKTGPGRLYYRLALNYAPKTLMLGAYDNGFTVKRTYEAVDDPSDVKKDAQGVWHIKAGATVKAKLNLTADGHRYHVALTDPIPAGMEPVNTALEGTRELRKQKVQVEGADDAEILEDSDDVSTSESRFWYPWWMQQWYEHQNLRDFRAEAFSSSLYSGNYKYNYLMRASTPGDYFVPPTKVEEMYTPETFGRAASEHVIIE